MTEAEIAQLHAATAAERARHYAETAGVAWDAFVCRFDDPEKEPIAL